MFGSLLLRVIVGVAVGTAVAGTAYVVYKVLTKDQIKEDVEEQIHDQVSEETYEKIFDIKIKEKVKKGDIYSIEDIDKWAEEDTVVVDVRDRQRNTIISDITVTGDEIGDDIRVGSVIKLYE